MKWLFSIILYGLALTGFSETPSIDFDEGRELVIHNRILAKVNDKTISVLDVVKKMDVFLTRHYPQFAQSKIARFEFYMNNWVPTLNQLIDQELILADAEGKELKVSDGDVRETLQERFGPNVMATLDKLGLTYEEARKMIHSEMIVDRMTWFKVHSKALIRVGPQDVKNSYHEYCRQKIGNDEWKYRVMTIRIPDEKQGLEIAKKAHELLAFSKSGMEAVVTELVSNYQLPSEQLISLSQEYQVSDRDLAESHKSVLLNLQPGSYSAPIPQQSRVDGRMVYRIFYLSAHKILPTPPFHKLAVKIKEDLLQQASGEENQLYIEKIRKKYGFDEEHMKEMIPSDFQPFYLR